MPSARRPRRACLRGLAWEACRRTTTRSRPQSSPASTTVRRPRLPGGLPRHDGRRRLSAGPWRTSSRIKAACATSTTCSSSTTSTARRLMSGTAEALSTRLARISRASWSCTTRCWPSPSGRAGPKSAASTTARSASTTTSRCQSRWPIRPTPSRQAWPTGCCPTRPTPCPVPTKTAASCSPRTTR